jgi:membrane protein DedA with SNARE-associated domain/rhodanese-related sulfurtransferase
MQELTHLIEVYGLALVFGLVLLDEIGLPVPSLPALVVAGAAARNGHFSLPAVLGAAMTGALLADIIWYWTARRFGRRTLAILCRISLAPDSCVRQTESLFNRVGSWSLLFARYVPAFTNIAVAMAAILRLPLAQFLSLNLAGSFLYYGLATLLGALFHRAVADILHTMATFGAISIVAVIAIFAVYVLLRWWERVTFARQLRMDRITVEELVGLMDSGTPPVILDVRSQDTRDRDGIIPGALAAHPQDIHPLLEELSPETEIVVYCACPNEASAAIAARHLKRAGFKKIRPLLGGTDAWVGSGRSLAKAARSTLEPV